MKDGIKMSSSITEGGYCPICDTVYDKPHTHRSDILMFANTYDHFQFSKLKDGSNRIEIKVNGQANYIDRNQAYMLMLWLQEHLK